MSALLLTLSLTFASLSFLAPLTGSAFAPNLFVITAILALTYRRLPAIRLPLAAAALLIDIGHFSLGPTLLPTLLILSLATIVPPLLEINHPATIASLAATGALLFDLAATPLLQPSPAAFAHAAAVDVLTTTLATLLLAALLRRVAPPFPEDGQVLP